MGVYRGSGDYYRHRRRSLLRRGIGGAGLILLGFLLVAALALVGLVGVALMMGL
jgi:hypothetical protein